MTKRRETASALSDRKGSGLLTQVALLIREGVHVSARNARAGKDRHSLVVCRYVERNALRAGLVERAEQWAWSSLWRRRRVLQVFRRGEAIAGESVPQVQRTWGTRPLNLRKSAIANRLAGLAQWP